MLCQKHAELADRIQAHFGGFLQLLEVLEPIETVEDGMLDWIGPYRILDLLGEGGMGTVYLGEQRKPVVRRVAVKVIKRGMDTKRVLARFEAERQALAMMEHDNIAKVLDAGSTGKERAYFVMEYVKGVPITATSDWRARPRIPAPGAGCLPGTSDTGGCSPRGMTLATTLSGRQVVLG